MPTLKEDSTIPQNEGTLDGKRNGESHETVVFPHLFFFLHLDMPLVMG